MRASGSRGRLDVRTRIGDLARSRRARRLLGASLVVVLLLAIADASASPPERLRTTDRPDEAVVQLRCAPLPQPLTALAVHGFFASFDPDEERWHRWEVWQDPGCCTTSWGHVHEDLTSPDATVGGGAFWVEREWRGDDARRLLLTLHESGKAYPHRDSYWAWPGPNCNTYVAWVLRESAIACDLPPRAVGKDWAGLAGADVTTTGTGVQVETPLLGLKVGARDGVEVHVLCATFGLAAWPPALKTPFGRLGSPPR